MKKINIQRSSTWILTSLWGACERWSKSDCIDLSAAFAYYTLQSFFPILLISLSIASWFLGKQEGLDQEIISIAAQILPPSVVELVETTLFRRNFEACTLQAALTFLEGISSSQSLSEPL